MMMFREAFRMSVKAVAANKMRSFLTMLGIIIGVMALVVLVSVANGTTESVADSIHSMGTNTFTVRISDDKNNPLAEEELYELTKDLDAVGDISPVSTGQAEVALTGSADSSGETSSVNVNGTFGSYEEIMGLTMTEGRFFNVADLQNHTTVAVISQDLAEDALGSSHCVGQTIRLSGVWYQVIGVVESSSSGRRGRNSSSYRSYEAYVPFTTLVRQFDSVSSEITSFVASAKEEDRIDEAESQLTAMMLNRFRQDSDAFSIQNQSEIAETMAEVRQSMTMMLGGIAAISLLVGGIGIMNIMLVSVTERTREIGIRKAIGASRAVIMLQFLIEAMILSLMGCAIGIIGSAAAVKIVGLVGGSDYHLSVPVVVVSVVFSSLIGILFGLYPANKAAKKKPIEALRYVG